MRRKYSIREGSRPVVLTVAGLDPSAGAGVAADLRALVLEGVYGAAVITATTLQSGRGVSAVRLEPPVWVGRQVARVLEDLPVSAIKTGMLGSAACVREVARAIEARPRPLVLDPVLRATSGTALLGPRGMREIRSRLLPLATVVTPNLDEAEALLGETVRDLQAMREAARELVALGAGAALVKGGHLEGRIVDVWYDGVRCRQWVHPRQPSRHARGTGCVLSALLAAGLARGWPPGVAARWAVGRVAAILARSVALGRGRGPADPLLLGGRSSRH